MDRFPFARHENDNGIAVGIPAEAAEAVDSLPTQQIYDLGCRIVPFVADDPRQEELLPPLSPEQMAQVLPAELARQTAGRMGRCAFLTEGALIVNVFRSNPMPGEYIHEFLALLKDQPGVIGVAPVRSNQRFAYIFAQTPEDKARLVAIHNIHTTVMDRLRQPNNPTEINIEDAQALAAAEAARQGLAWDAAAAKTIQQFFKVDRQRGVKSDKYRLASQTYVQTNPKIIEWGLSLEEVTQRVRPATTPAEKVDETPVTVSPADLKRLAPVVDSVVKALDENMTSVTTAHLISRAVTLAADLSQEDRQTLLYLLAQHSSLSAHEDGEVFDFTAPPKITKMRSRNGVVSEFDGLGLIKRTGHKKRRR
jgi:hypothetical protein